MSLVIHTVEEWNHHIRRGVGTWCFRTEEEADEFRAEMNKRCESDPMTEYIQDEEILWDNPAEAIAMYEEITRWP